MGENPWLSIPLADYEGHMEAVGQAAALRSLFVDVYEVVTPTRLAVLGCTSGADFDGLDPAITEVALGVDINARYLAAAGRRAAALGRRVQFVCGDVLHVTLPQAPFDLVHPRCFESRSVMRSASGARSPRSGSRSSACDGWRR
jgi:SAM-dependent methyltransferase